MDRIRYHRRKQGWKTFSFMNFLEFLFANNKTKGKQIYELRFLFEEMVFF